MRRIAFMGCLLAGVATYADDLFALKPLMRTEIYPAVIARMGEGHFFVDFGQDAFGYLMLEADSPRDAELEIHLGEKANGMEVDRKPGGSIRYVVTKLKLKAGKRSYRVETPADKRNTGGAAVLLPKEIGVVLPFRYAEVIGSPIELDRSTLRQVMVHYPCDESAAMFTSSDPALNDVWKLCKYSILATTFAGIYVDGDRERIPYEADAYINQLSHYYVDHEYALARHTHEYLLKHPTWPTEWKQFSVLIAHADWLYSGDAESIRRNYDLLKNEKTLTKHAREDGLLDTSKLKDVVDWPAGERDGYQMSAVNTVVNAFHYRTLVCMSEMAEAIGEKEDAEAFEEQAIRVRGAIFNKLVGKDGVFVDGEGVTHSSLHANLFPFAFGLVPDATREKVIAFIKSRGMACSVYPAQFLLEGLFENGETEYALQLLTSDGERSWRNMIATGSTITTEAWDIKFKPNLDWNHAWGAAPANIIPRYVLGVRPLSPGFARAIIAPQPGKLERAHGIVPTIHGGIEVTIDGAKLSVVIPEGIKARVVWGTTMEVGSGTHTFESAK